MLTDVLTIVRLDLGLLFMVASASKLIAPRQFIEGVIAYHILPTTTAVPLAVVLIPLEAFLSLAHFTGWWLSQASMIGLVTLLAFCAAVGVNLVRRREMLCHCFGADDSEMLSIRTLVRLIVLILAEFAIFGGLALQGALRSQLTRFTTMNLLTGYLPWAFLSLLLLTWVFRAPEVIELLRGQRCKTCSAKRNS